MKKRLKEEDAEQILNTDAFVGHIVRLASIAEYRLDSLLAFYFSKSDDIGDFLLLVAKRLNFSVKIEILSNLIRSKKIKSRGKLLRVLRGLSYLRNKLAHESHIDGAELTKITDNADAMMFVTASRKERGHLKTGMEVSFLRMFDAFEKARKTSTQQGTPRNAKKRRA